MGQRVSSCSHPSYGDYEKLKSEEDSIVQKKNKSQKEDSYQQLHFQCKPYSSLFLVFAFECYIILISYSFIIFFSFLK
jgi:hypothetical protein